MDVLVSALSLRKSPTFINNNVFFYARKFFVYVEEVIGNTISLTILLIGARKRD
jgi:hypothetical protein